VSGVRLVEARPDGRQGRWPSALVNSPWQKRCTDANEV